MTTRAESAKTSLRNTERASGQARRCSNCDCLNRVAPPHRGPHRAQQSHHYWNVLRHQRRRLPLRHPQRQRNRSGRVRPQREQDCWLDGRLGDPPYLCRRVTHHIRSHASPINVSRTGNAFARRVVRISFALSCEDPAGADPRPSAGLANSHRLEEAPAQ